ncbi:hypothetical protein NC661_00780 [Aquibacillus koreensis]|uniref:Uncharacterized protein n=2 Tax=Aquibacillus koreensis TaxID=279446 RepID=A0A9X3WK79_9BACI|nr:hypothetical protein [Aquibacillus koreensis]MDC3418919.1 hypothetical protein [Aquibacillus koreensis]
MKREHRKKSNKKKQHAFSEELSDGGERNNQIKRNQNQIVVDFKSSWNNNCFFTLHKKEGSAKRVDKHTGRAIFAVAREI